MDCSLTCRSRFQRDLQNIFDIEYRNQKMSETKEQIVISVLQQFMTEMMCWEEKCFLEIRQSDFSAADLRSKTKKHEKLLKTIFKNYCTLRKRKENHIGAYGSPTTYNPKLEKVINVVFETKNKAIVFTEKEWGIKFNRYILLNKNNRWLIDKRQKLTLNKKWGKAIL